MMTAPLDLGRQARDAGIRRVTRDDAVMHCIQTARDWAESYARRHGQVCINDVRRVLNLDALPPNAIGAIFRDKRFIVCGYTQAEHPGAHARTIKIFTVKTERSA
jgi:hypothetical protein